MVITHNRPARLGKEFIDFSGPADGMKLGRYEFDFKKSRAFKYLLGRQKGPRKFLQ